MKIRLGISACLLGRRVRYDGGHKYDPYLAETLGGQAEYVPVCPEFEAGLGVPREPMRLEGGPDAPRLVVISTGEDLTGRMREWSLARARELGAEGLSGFILKARSPSCGVGSVEVFTGECAPVAVGTGLFARALMEAYPGLPVEDEERLRDPAVRKEFMRRVNAYYENKKEG